MNSKRIQANRLMKIRLQDMKEEINKDMETLISNQSEVNSSITQIKISIGIKLKTEY
jgi:hypothetical protein